jgi:hypothetical protein
MSKQKWRLTAPKGMPRSLRIPRSHEPRCLALDTQNLAAQNKEAAEAHQYSVRTLQKCYSSALALQLVVLRVDCIYTAEAPWGHTIPAQGLIPYPYWVVNEKCLTHRKKSWT